MNETNEYLDKTGVAEAISNINKLSIPITKPQSLTLTPSDDSINIFYMNNIDIEQFTKYINTHDNSDSIRKSFTDQCNNSLILAKEASTDDEHPILSLIYVDNNGYCMLLGSSRFNDIVSYYKEVFTSINQDISTLIDKDALNSQLSNYFENNGEVLNNIIQNAINSTDSIILQNIHDSIKSQLQSEITALTGTVSDWNTTLQQYGDSLNANLNYQQQYNEIITNFGYTDSNNTSHIDITKNSDFRNKIHMILLNDSTFNSVNDRVSHHIKNSYTGNVVHENSKISVNDLKQVLQDNISASAYKEIDQNLIFVFNYVLNRLFNNDYRRYEGNHQVEMNYHNYPDKYTSMQWLGGYNNLMYNINKRLQTIEEKLNIE